MSFKGSITTNDVKEDKRQEFLQTLFTDFTMSPVAFKSPAVVYNFLRHRLGVTNVSFKEVRDFERQYVLRPNQIIRKKVNRFPRLNYHAKGLNDQWQLDLIDLHGAPGQKGNKFLLGKIDVFQDSGC